LQDQQNKIYFAKIKQEKQADEAHRRKIKEQIARDREEKMAERQRRVQETTTDPVPSSQRKDTRYIHTYTLLTVKGTHLPFLSVDSMMCAI
jgi:hypothetical protein